MKRFHHREVREALAYAEGGGQALHTWTPGPDAATRFPKAPAVFKRHAAQWAHLFDADAARLDETARKLGVRRVVIERRGERGQHVDLCGGPLERAIAQCERDNRPKPQLALVLLALPLLALVLVACEPPGDVIACRPIRPEAPTPTEPEICDAYYEACLGAADAVYAVDVDRIGRALAEEVYAEHRQTCQEGWAACVGGAGFGEQAGDGGAQGGDGGAGDAGAGR